MFKNHNNKRKIRKIRKLTKQLKEIAEINSHLHSCIKGDGRIIDCYSDFLTKPTIRVYSKQCGTYSEFRFILSSPRREIAIEQTLRVDMMMCNGTQVIKLKEDVIKAIRDEYIKHLTENLTVEVLYADR